MFVTIVRVIFAWRVGLILLKTNKRGSWRPPWEMVIVQSFDWKSGRGVQHRLSPSISWWHSNNHFYSSYRSSGNHHAPLQAIFDCHVWNIINSTHHAKKIRTVVADIFFLPLDWKVLNLIHWRIFSIGRVEKIFFNIVNNTFFFHSNDIYLSFILISNWTRFIKTKEKLFYVLIGEYITSSMLK